MREEGRKREGDRLSGGPLPKWERPEKERRRKRKVFRKGKFSSLFPEFYFLDYLFTNYN